MDHRNEKLGPCCQSCFKPIEPKCREYRSWKGITLFHWDGSLYCPECKMEQLRKDALREELSHQAFYSEYLGVPWNEEVDNGN